MIKLLSVTLNPFESVNIPEPPPPPASNVVTRVENDADGAANAPDISVANCAELDTVPVGILTPPDSKVVTRVENDALGAVNDPLILEAICTEPDNKPVGNEVKNEPV